jgi:heme-degrading monooxygenase HmoA
MFAVLFEVRPKAEKWDDYLGYARQLKPKLELIDGFIENIRYQSLTREGWLLSLSIWRNEKAVVRWRTHGEHHQVQEKGRFEVFEDYHLRVGELTGPLQEPRPDETEVGAATRVSLIDRQDAPEAVKASAPEGVALGLGLDKAAHGLVAWDVFEAILTPGEVILLLSWRDATAAEGFEARTPLAGGARLRRVRIVRDYGMFDRREAPQYYSAVERHAR